MNNNIVRVGLAAAAVVVIAIIAINLLPGTALPGGEPSVSPSVEPSVAPSVADPSAAAQGMEPGPYVLWEDAPEVGTVTVTISEPLWTGDPGMHILRHDNNVAPPDGAGMLLFVGDLWVYGDPCQWSTTTPDTPSTTVDELMAALGSQATRNATEPEDITIGGYPGKSTTLTVPDDADFGACDQGRFGTLAEELAGERDSSPSRFAQGPGQIDEFWAADVNGQLVMFDITSGPETPADVIQDMYSIAESAAFGQ
jgi:hypothetical protein